MCKAYSLTPSEHISPTCIDLFTVLCSGVVPFTPAVFIQHYDDEQPIVPHESGSRSSQQAGGDAGPANMGYWHLADPVAASANR